MEELIPGLPNDVGMLCLGRIPYQSHDSIQGVCKNWKAVINNLLFYSYRSKHGFTKKKLCIAQAISPTSFAQKNGAAPSFRLSTLDTETKRQLWLPFIPDFPESFPLFCQCACVNGELFVIGGWNPHTYDTISSVYAFNFSSGCWRKAADMKTPRSFFACGVLEDCIIIAGGHNSDKNALSSAEVYSPSENSWKNLPEMSQERDECKGVVLNGKLYVLSGYSTEYQGRFTNSADMFDPEEGTWIKIEEIWIEGAAPRSAFTWNGKFFAFQGQTLLGFDVTKKHWNVIDSIPHKGEVSCVNLVRDEVIVMVRIGDECRTFAYNESKDQGQKGKWKLMEQEMEFCWLPQFACNVEL